jgi:SAM-dependent methyltransferase
MQSTDLEAIYGHRWAPGELAGVRAIWRVLVRDFFQKLVPQDAAVLDIGCGFCHFLNEVEAAQRVGADANPAARGYAERGVDVRTIGDLQLLEFEENHFDFIFISNFLEHLENGQAVLQLLRRVRALLSPRGRVVILQPNFRLLGWRYFDFIDHKTILTDASVREALELSGLSLERQILSFLPYTTKSRLPRSPALVRLYLRLPPIWKILGKQSLFIARRTPL